MGLLDPSVRLGQHALEGRADIREPGKRSCSGDAIDMAFQLEEDF